MTLVSQAEYARRLGVSRAAVAQWKKSGRLVLQGLERLCRVIHRAERTLKTAGGLNGVQVVVGSNPTGSARF